MLQVSGGCRPPKIFDGHTSVKFYGGLHPEKYLMDIHPSNVCGVYTPKIFDGSISVKCLTHAHASVVWGVYTPETFGGCMSVKYLGGLDPPNI